MNQYSQLMEHSPYCERDLRLPENLETHDEYGDFKVLIKKQGLISPYTYGIHLFDYVDWDGYQSPYALNALGRLTRK